MTRAERRELRANIAWARRAAHHPDAGVRAKARHALEMLERAEAEDPRPSWWLRWRLRLGGVDAG